MATRFPDITVHTNSDNRVGTVGKREWLFAVYSIGVVALGVLIVLVCLNQPQRPGVTPATATTDVFSAERAMRHVRALAREAHPAGTLADHNAAEYIYAQLLVAGLSPQIQNATYVTRDRGSFFRSIQVRNIIVRMKGSDSHKAVLFMAHYDSAIGSFGAADDAAGIVALMETAAILNSEPALKNDIIFLFTDGEECGLFGAKAFAEQNPWFSDVALVVNFEARGNSGPAVLFETGDADGWLVQKFLRAVRYPVAESFVPALYKLLPNDTDMSVFRAHHLPGLNFAFADGWQVYHSQLDTPGRLDLRSLQHEGDIALQLARTLTTTKLSPTSEQHLVYFNILGPVVISYSYLGAQLMSGLLAGLFALLLYIDVRSRSVEIKQLFLSLVAPPMVTLLVPLVSAACWWLVFARSRLGEQFAYQNTTYSLALVTFSCGAFGLAYYIVDRKSGLIHLVSATALWWTVVSILAAITMPASSYLFAVGAIISLLTYAGAIVYNQRTRADVRPLAVLVLLAVPVGGMVVLVPVVRMLFTAVPTGEFLIAAPIVMLCTLMLPYFWLISRWTRWIVPVIMMVSGMFLFCTALLSSRFSGEHPKSDTAVYVDNWDEHLASWLVLDSQRDSWTDQFVQSGHHVTDTSTVLPGWYAKQSPWGGGAWQASAPVISDPPPQAVIMQRDVLGSTYRLKLRIFSPRHAPEIWVSLEMSAQLRLATVDGRGLDRTLPVWENRTVVPDASGGSIDRGFVLLLFGVPSSGTTLTLEGATPFHGKLFVLDRSYSLPSSLTSFSPRPSELIPARSAGDGTVLFRVYQLN